MSSVKIIKFLSEREVIAKIVDDGKTTLTVQSPLAIQPLRSGESSMSLGMMPFSWVVITANRSRSTANTFSA